MAVTTSSRCPSARWTQGCPVYKLTRNSRATACGDFWPRWTADGGNDGLTARGIAIGWFPTRLSALCWMWPGFSVSFTPTVNAWSWHTGDRDLMALGPSSCSSQTGACGLGKIRRKIQDMKTTLRSLVPVILISLASVPAARSSDVAQPLRAEMLERPDGRRLPGKLTGDPRSGFRFDAAGAAAPIRLEPGSVVAFEGPGPDPTTAYPPFRVELGLGQRISGRLGAVDETLGPADRELGGRAGRPSPGRGSRRSIQRPGEVLVFQDGFETIDGTPLGPRCGDPDLVERAPARPGEHSLRIPAGGTSLTCRLAEPVGSGRLEIAFHDDGALARRPAVVRRPPVPRPAGPETVRAVLGWSEESLAVESPGGPALAVQRLARKPGWHRLSVRFGPEQTEVAVDGNDLAHGKGPDGPLVEIRLASLVSRQGPAAREAGRPLRRPPAGPVRRAGRRPRDRRHPGRGPPGRRRPALRHDRRGRRRAGAADGRRQGRRACPGARSRASTSAAVAAPGAPVEGLLVRLEWRSAPGDDPRDLDAGRRGPDGRLRRRTHPRHALCRARSTIPRDRLRRLRVQGSGRRIVIDPTAHHLGDEISTTPPLLDPPQPEGGVLERIVRPGRGPRRRRPRWCSTSSRSSARRAASSSPRWSRRASCGPTSRSTASPSTT